MSIHTRLSRLFSTTANADPLRSLIMDAATDGIHKFSGTLKTARPSGFQRSAAFVTKIKPGQKATVGRCTIDFRSAIGKGSGVVLPTQFVVQQDRVTFTFSNGKLSPGKDRIWEYDVEIALAPKTEATATAMPMVPKTILEQLGGNKFVTMTGAKDFIYNDNSLTFSVGKNAKRVSKVKISLDPKKKPIRGKNPHTFADTYTIEYFTGVGTNMRTAAKSFDVYNNMLRDNFTFHTGLDTSLGTPREPGAGDNRISGQRVTPAEKPAPRKPVAPASAIPATKAPPSPPPKAKSASDERLPSNVLKMLDGLSAAQRELLKKALNGAKPASVGTPAGSRANMLRDDVLQGPKAVTPELQRLSKQIERMTDQNDHTTAVLLLATFLKDESSATALKAIKERHMKRGSLDPKDRDLRTNIMQSLFKQVDREFAPEAAQLIRSAF